MDFSAYVDQIESLYLSAGGSLTPSPSPLTAVLDFIPKRLLIIAPHPDDECLMSGLALRAKAEAGTEVSVLSFSFGSDLDRRPERMQELKGALQVLGFDELSRTGADEIQFPELERVLERFLPDAILIPHSNDGHPTHIRCSELAWQAAKAHVAKTKVPLHVFESEYWGQMENPNLLLPLDPSTVKVMGTALLCHEGEIKRNPYHLSLPAFLMDQFRRGSERIAGFGKTSEPALFAELYRHSVLS